MGASSSANNVFINCPFDDEYQPLFDATIFAVVACGFNARCALEADDGGQNRIDKIYDIIGDCRYGIHDLSRVQLDEDNQLPRFNMPLELGIALGARRYGGEEHRKMKMLIHEKVKRRHHKTTSDLSGMDGNSHEDFPKKVIANVYTFLRTNSKRTSIPSAKRI